MLFHEIRVIAYEMYSEIKKAKPFNTENMKNRESPFTRWLIAWNDNANGSEGKRNLENVKELSENRIKIKKFAYFS